MRFKKGAGNAVVWIVLVIAVVGLYGLGAFDRVLGTTPAQAVAPGVTTIVGGVAVPGVCEVATTSTKIGPTQDKYNPTTKLTTIGHRVFRNGVDEGTITDSTTKTYAPGDKLKIYYGLNETIAYTSEGDDITLPCSGSVNTVALDGDGDIYLNATPSFSWRNSDGQVGGNVVSSTNQSVSSGDTKNVIFKLSGVYKKAYSPYGPIDVAVEYCPNQIASVDINGATAGTALVQNTVTNAGNTTKWFRIEGPVAGKGMLSSAEKEYTLTIQMDDDSTDGAQQTEIRLKFYDWDAYQNTKTGKVEWGYEDDSSADVGGGSATARDIQLT